MENSDLNYFVTGLKSVIKSEWPSQEKFAEGVTSKVNLSNVLRLQRGASHEMRKNLAARAGLTVEEVIAIGKRKLHPEADEPKVTTEPSSSGIPFNADELSAMRSAELNRKVGWYSSEIIDKMMAHAKQVGATLNMLTEERNRIQELLLLEQKIANTIEEAIKVVNRDLRIVYCNQAYVSMNPDFFSDDCAGSLCEQCKTGCIAEKVFTAGKPDRSLVERNGSWIYLTAYPMKSEIGIIDHVVIVSREMNLFQMLEEQGWECHPKKKK